MRSFFFESATLAAKVLVLSALVSGAWAESDDELHERRIVLEQLSPVFATKGNATVTQADFDAFINRIPKEDRASFLESHERVGDSLDRLMLTRLLAEDAIARGALEEKINTAQLLQATYVFLAERQLEHVWEEGELADYSSRAREYYRLNRAQFQAEMSVDFTYLLVGTPEDDQSEAQRLATELRERIEDGESFDALVVEYSRAPDAQENQGSHRGIAREELDPTFANALFALNEGEISGPVETPFGIVLIRQDAYEAGDRILSYDEVEDEVIEIVRRQHRTDIQDRYMARLVSQPLELAEGAVANLYERYEVLDPATRRELLREVYDELRSQFKDEQE